MTEMIAPERMAEYKRTAVAREKARRDKIAQRRAAALDVAQAAAALLRQQFGAIHVVLFGSTAHGYWFTEESDIDLAVEGIAVDQFWRAWNAVDALDPSFEINLVAWEEATPALLTSIEREGVIL